MVVNGVIIDQSAVTMKEIADLIGINTHNAGTVVVPGAFGFTNLINEKSKDKPMEFHGETISGPHGEVFGQYTKLHPTQKESVNYGHEYQFYENPLLALRALALPRTDSRCFFRYSYPYSWYRPTDFWGYNHYADNWFSVYSKGYVGTIPKVGRDSGSLPLTFNGIEDVFHLGALSKITAGDVNFGFLMWQGPLTETSPAQMLWYQLTDFTTEGGQFTEVKDKLFFTPTTAKAPMLTNGVWNMYPCLTTFGEPSVTAQSGVWVREENELMASWIMYPFCNVYQVEIVNRGEGDTEVIGNISVEYNEKESDWTMETGGLSYTIRKLVISFINTADATYTVSAKAEFLSKLTVRLPESGAISYPFVVSDFVIGPGSEESPSRVDIVLKGEPKDENDVLRLELVESGLILDVQYSLTRDNTIEVQNARLEINV